MKDARKNPLQTGTPATASPEESGPWWRDLVTSAIHNPVFDTRRSIFTNRTLRFDKIKAVGFDFDHTLAVYNCQALDDLAKRLVCDKLIAEEGMPASFVDQMPDPTFAVKGLIVDIEMGNVIKVDRFGHVVRAYHGTRRLTGDEKRQLYGEADVIPHVTHGDRYRQVDSAFAKPEVLIFSALAPHHAGKSCTELWKTIRRLTDQIHRDGSLKEIITRNPLDYLHPDFETIGLLRHLRDSGKRVFLLTNSEWEYTRAMMNAAIGLAADPDDLEWINLFDLVVCEAKKPKYFTNRKDSTAETVDGNARLIRGGNIDDLQRRLGGGNLDVLYVGDHIYADLITSKRASYWRTMLVVSELDEELEAQSYLPGMASQLRQVDERRRLTELEVHHWKATVAALERYDGDHEEVRRFVEECQRHQKRATHALHQYIRQRESLRSRMSDATNKYWGSLFRAGSDLTYYGRQVEDFACVYTSRATNLRSYPRDHYFRSTMDYLPHELESM